MKFRSLLGAAALVAAIALPTITSAQGYRRHRSSSHGYYGGGYVGRGPFYPSRIPGPSYRYFGSGGPYRINGLTYDFGPGGATYYLASPFGSYGDYGPSRRRASRYRRDSRPRRDYPLRTSRDWR